MSDGPRRDDKPAGERTGSAGGSTRSVHSGERDSQETHAVTTPIYQTSTYWFENSAELRALQEGRDKRDEYGRYSNPTWRAVERKLCDLEGAEIQEYLVKLDVETTVIEPAETDKLANALRDGTSIFFTESPTNPYLRVIDLPKAVEIAHARGAKVAIDSTFATPLCHRPLEYGADYAIHSATKYLGGHNDLLAGVVLGSAAALEPIREAAGVLGGVIDAHSAYLLLRGLKTLALRMEKHNNNALQVARWLEGNAAVRRVWYPGLESHPDHATAGRLMQGWGGVVTFEVESNFDGTCRFIDACQIPYIAPSLGGVETLIEMPALMSFWDLKPEQRLELGITDSLVRLSCGVEDAEDLIADLEQALGSI